MKDSSRFEMARKTLDALDVEALYIEQVETIYYFTGLQVSTGALFIFQDREELILDARYYAMAEGGPIAVRLAGENALKEACNVKKVAFDSTCTSYATYLRLKEILPKISWVAHPNLSRQLRQVKDKNAIQALRSAADLGTRGFDFVLRTLQEGITEKAVARELEIFWLKEGGDKLAFDPIIAFGEGSAIPHYHPQDRRLKNGDIVLVDIGVSLAYYQSDMTRTLFFGQIKPRLREIYQVVLEAQKAALGLAKAGAKAGDLDCAAREVIEAKGYGPYFTHGLGHGIGIEIHELPVIRNTAPHADVVLEQGMALTVEPGIYLPGEGGVRIEDSIIITQEGYENLTQKPKDLMQI